jgi:hypothetical protein
MLCPKTMKDTTEDRTTMLSALRKPGLSHVLVLGVAFLMSCDPTEESEAPPDEPPVTDCGAIPEAEILIVMDGGSWSAGLTTAAECPTEQIWCVRDDSHWANVARSAQRIASGQMGISEVGTFVFPAQAYDGTPNYPECEQDPLASRCDSTWPQMPIGTDWTVTQNGGNATNSTNQGVGSATLALDRAWKYLVNRSEAGKVQVVMLYTNAGEKCEGSLARVIQKLRSDGIWVMIVALNETHDEALSELARQGGIYRSEEGQPAYYRLHEDLEAIVQARVSDKPREICDGVDNDCDGLTDEGIARDCAVMCGGVQQCVMGQWHSCGPTVPERPEHFYRVRMSDPNSYPAAEVAAAKPGYGTQQGAVVAVDDGTPAPGTEYCETFSVETGRSLVDIVWVIDQSGSMAQEIANVRQNINNFASFLSDLEIDHHTVMLASRFNDPDGHEVCVPAPLAGPTCADNTEFRQIDQHVDSHNALELIESNFADIHAFTRFGSSKQIVVVTDDVSAAGGCDGRCGSYSAGCFCDAGCVQYGDCCSDYQRICVEGEPPASRPGSEFKSFIDAQPGWEGFTFHGIIGSDGASCSSGYSPVYETLVEDTGGQAFDICSPDWSSLFDSLAATVITIAVQHTLTYPPQTGSIEITASGELLAENTDWYWISDPGAIVLHDTLPSNVESIEVCYIVASDDLPGDDPRPLGPSTAEYCDGKDNDCNGVVDDGFDVGATCSVGLGACERAGRIVCQTQKQTACNAEVAEATAEICDGIDNDCDGSVDENTTELCSDGCLQRSCQNGQLSVCSAPYDQEYCDGIDNTCNGLVDDGFQIGEPCSVTSGGCTGTGTIVCDGASASRCELTDGAPRASKETCDGIDNDCDGDIDEYSDDLCPNPGEACYDGKCLLD